MHSRLKIIRSSMVKKVRIYLARDRETNVAEHYNRNCTNQDVKTLGLTNVSPSADNFTLASVDLKFKPCCGAWWIDGPLAVVT